jgi:hypothetical protein
MSNLIKSFAVAAGAMMSALVFAADSAQAFSFFFTKEFETGGTLTGYFQGTDVNGNGQLDASEFTLFGSEFTSSEPGFESVFWGEAQLAPFSYFIAPENYVFNLTNVGADRGWNSVAGLLEETVVGFAPSSSIVAGVFFEQESLDFEASEAVPEPATMLGMALAGSTLILRRRKQA